MNYSNKADPDSKALQEKWKDKFQVCVPTSVSLIIAADFSCLSLSDYVAQHKPRAKCW